MITEVVEMSVNNNNRSFLGLTSPGAWEIKLDELLPLVVQMMDRAIQRINHYPVDKC